MNPDDPPQPAAPPAPEVPGKGRKRREDRRRAYIAARHAGQDQLPLFEETGAAGPLTRNPNQRVASRLLKLFVMVVIANALLFALAAYWFYRRTHADVQQSLAQIAAQGLSADAVRQAIQSAGAAPGPADAKLQELETSVATRIDDLKKQLGGSQQELADLKQKLAASAESAEETTRRLAGLETKAGAKPGPSAPLSQETDVTPAQSELVLLKERNRLTEYADEAIATGLRGPYERLWDSIEDPRLAMLVSAARAEILRVQDCFINGRRVKFYGIQQYQIPVADVFPDSAALSPAQLSDDQMIRLLLDQKQPWQTRVKAAWFLGQRRSTKVGDALVKAVKDDPSLDVAAEATFSFEQITGYHARIFEVKPIEAWWTAYKAGPPKSQPPARPAKADAKKETPKDAKAK